jgi:nitrite reductase/ring-hydroxylating ferredoxin subunit
MEESCGFLSWYVDDEQSTRKVSVRCPKCGQSFSAKAGEFSCPKCFCKLSVKAGATTSADSQLKLSLWQHVRVEVGSRVFHVNKWKYVLAPETEPHRALVLEALPAMQHALCPEVCVEIA